MPDAFISYDVVKHIVELLVFIPETRDELDEAVALWLSNETMSRSMYGPISYWNIRNITNLHRLLCGEENQNREMCYLDLMSLSFGTHLK